MISSETKTGTCVNRILTKETSAACGFGRKVRVQDSKIKTSHTSTGSTDDNQKNGVFTKMAEIYVHISC